MGCTGSKPHLLLTSGGGGGGGGNSCSNGVSGLAPSPQKGFILFNSKTLAYLRANQNEIKPTLAKRCAQKVSSSTANGGASGGSSKSSSLLKTKKTNLIAAAASGTAPLDDHSKLMIENAVDYVMNYALNEFDIDSFSRSNHLSMKQIRKDILKKATNDTSNEFVNTPFYKIALNTAIDEFGTYIKEHFIAINEFKEEKQQQQPSSPSSGVESKSEGAAVKANGDVAADEKTTTESVATSGTMTSEEEAAEALKLKEALEVARQNFYKGKVSLVCLSKHGEGYVVKEMQNQPNATNTSPAAGGDTAAVKTTLDTSTSGESAPKINVEDADVSTNRDDVSQLAGPGELKSVSNMSVRSIPIEPMSRSSLDEFVALRDSMDMLGVMRETLECIVRYSTRPSDEEMDTREPAALTANLLKTARIIEAMRRLDEHDQVHCVDVKLVEGVLNLDYVVDEFRSYLRLARDEASKRLGTEEYCKCLDEMSGVVERVAVAIESTPVKLFTSKGLPPPRELNSTSVLANVTSSSSSVSKDQRAETAGVTMTTGAAVAAATSNGISKHVKHHHHHHHHHNTHENNETSDSSPMPPIDIKKEIAFSILNVGEVLAKTIDYYSLPSSESEELKELIKISEAQAAHEKKHAEAVIAAAAAAVAANTTSNSATGLVGTTSSGAVLSSSPTSTLAKPLQVNVNGQEDETKLKESPTEEMVSSEKTSSSVGGGVAAVATTTTTSSSSALSSPTISTTSSAATSSAGSGSISPANNNNANKSSTGKDEKDEVNEDRANGVEKNGILQHELVFLVDQISRESNGEYNGNHHHQQLEEQASQNVASSSSSDLIMTNNSASNHTSLKDQDNKTEGGEVTKRQQTTTTRESQEDAQAADMLVHQFITNIIEKASKRLSDGGCSGSSSAGEVEIEIEREQKPEVVFRGRSETYAETVNGSKRMSLDEELMYQLEDVDKKVKYMNETCSENEDDDDEDELNGQQFDKDYILNHSNNGNDEDDDERLFQPARRPAEIKSNVRRSNGKSTSHHNNNNNNHHHERRQIDLHEEIKQISTVIQDLVQTINVASTPEKNLNLPTKQTTTTTNGSSSSNMSTPTMMMNNNNNDKSLNNSRTSSIPVLRQRLLTKQKATTVATTTTTTSNTTDELMTSSSSASSFKTAAASTTIESFVEFSSNNSSAQSSPATAVAVTIDHNNSSTASPNGKFKSKLPVCRK